MTQVMESICKRGDWRAAQRLYSQLSAIANDDTLSGDALSNEVPSALAEALARTFASYEGSEQEFIDDLLLLLAGIDDLDPGDPATFRRLYFDIRLDRFDGYRTRPDGRRRPKPFEAAVETVRRICDLNTIQAALETSEPRLETTAILGGSLSYGRFYNTCGGNGKPSDIDLLLLINDYDELSQVAAKLSALKFVDAASATQLNVRAEAFLRYRSEYEPIVFRHKLRLWEHEPHEYALRFQVPAGNYLLGLHVVSPADFDHITLRDIPILGTGGPTSVFERKVFEYRDDQPRRHEEERSFSGSSRTHPADYRVVEGGCITDSLVCEVRDDRFYPGVHLNLILPRFEVRWESPTMRIRLKLLNLQWKLLARLQEEKERHGGHLALSQSHTRCALFSPHVTRSVDTL